MFTLQDVILAEVRAVADSFMTDTCTIERFADTTGEAGEVINAWVEVSTGNTCRMISEAARNRNEMMIVAEQAVLPERYRLVLPANTTIAPQYRVTLDSDDSKWLVENVITSQTDEVSTQVIVVPETP